MSDDRFGRLLVLHNPSPELLAFVSALTRLDSMMSPTCTSHGPVSSGRLAAQRQVVLQASGAFANRLKRDLPQLNQVMGIYAMDAETRELTQNEVASP